MRTGTKKFFFWAVLWNAGAFGLFFSGMIGATIAAEIIGKPSPVLWRPLCGLSFLGIVGMYRRLDTAEQISWTHDDFLLLGRWNEAWNIAGLFFVIMAGIACLCRNALVPPPSFSYIFWMAGAGALLLVPSHFLAVWHMENMEEIVREIPLTRARYKQ